MALGQGWQAQIGVGHESTWGTNVTRTKFMDFVEVSGGYLNPMVQRETFRGRSPLVPFRGAQKLDGQITSELLYEGWEDFFLHMFGKVATTTTNTTAKQHIFSFDDTLAMPIGLTVEVKAGEASTELWRGCKVESIQFVADIDKILHATFHLFGKDALGGATASTATYPVADVINWNNITLTKDAVATEVISMDITIMNGYLTDRRTLGNATVLEHTPGQRSLSGRLTAFFENLTAWRNTFVTDTSHELKMTGTGGAIAGSSPSDNYDFILTIPKVKVETLTYPINSPGPIIQEVGIRAHKDSLELATLTVTNLRATVP